MSNQINNIFQAEQGLFLRKDQVDRYEQASPSETERSKKMRVCEFFISCHKKLKEISENTKFQNAMFFVLYSVDFLLFVLLSNLFFLSKTKLLSIFLMGFPVLICSICYGVELLYNLCYKCTGTRTDFKVKSSFFKIQIIMFFYLGIVYLLREKGNVIHDFFEIF
ncbi:hypothetical protein EDEG_01759 [Edhazardia aedis USNM 41457]|uniref:Uncharacterized protein n=1 Tax=Edhazardia aedis (strain USNM 41457) TaxID=1003232 RepID=J9DN20_EDHAE|nr:hypothetical protein EDEG_01759 [Edhazardia aedis USNM 41457]|eukprot:EJW03950.1 hypothetical protein EDEG_01759 [Edhazardia aedis USNM 41457]